MTYSTGSMKQQRYSSSSNISNGAPIKNGNINGSQMSTNGNDELCIRMESNGDIRTNGTSQSSKISNNFDSVLNSYHHEDESQSTRAFRWVSIVNAHFAAVFNDILLVSFSVIILPSVRLRYVDDIRLNLTKIMLSIDNCIVSWTRRDNVSLVYTRSSMLWIRLTGDTR